MDVEQRHNEHGTIGDGKPMSLDNVLCIVKDAIVLLTLLFTNQNAKISVAQRNLAEVSLEVQEIGNPLHMQLLVCPSYRSYAILAQYPPANVSLCA